MKTILEALSSPTTEYLIAKVDYLQKLNAIWLKSISREWSDHCTIANFEKGVLTLSVPNSAWATRMRYLRPELHRILSNISHFSTLKEIQLKITYKLVENQQPITARHLSKQTRTILQQTAQAIEHSELKRLLNLLASR